MANAKTRADSSIASPLRIGIAGIGGKMGREIVSVADARDDIVVRGGIVAPNAPAGRIHLRPDQFLTTTPASLLDQVDVLIDFSAPAATPGLAQACAEAGTPLVCGVTGLSKPGFESLRAAAAVVPVFYAPNMSVGVAALIRIIPALAEALADADIEIVETHHRLKSDAPSGTAQALFESVRASRGREHYAAVHGREGSSQRQPGEVGIHAIRAGANSGEHTVIFADDGEEVRISHRALSRKTFAIGAVRAAEWIVRQPPGFYGMGDLLDA